MSIETRHWVCGDSGSHFATECSAMKKNRSKLLNVRVDDINRSGEIEEQHLYVRCGLYAGARSELGSCEMCDINLVLMTNRDARGGLSTLTQPHAHTRPAAPTPNAF